MLCPPVSEKTVEFDPTLGRLLESWTAVRTPLYRERFPMPTESSAAIRSMRLGIERLPVASMPLAKSRQVSPTRSRDDRPWADNRPVEGTRAERPASRDRQLAGAAGRPAHGRLRCWLAIRLGLSAHQVTLLALGSWLLAALAIGTGDRFLFVVGVALAQLGFWLDHVDGQVARWRGTACLDGVYLDYLMHHAANLTLGFALGFGLAVSARRPPLGGCRVRDRRGLGRPEPAQRLPLQGILSAAEE